MPFYDNFSAIQPTPAGSRMAESIAVNQINAILKQHKDVRDVLELGPGRGPFAHQCRQRNFNYVCADISLRLLKELQSAPKRIQAYVPPLPLASASFDIAFAANFLEHMLDFKHALYLIEEMARVVRTNGLVCHCVPDFMDWGMHFWNGDYTHSFPTTPRRVMQAYVDAGLRDMKIYRLSGPWIGPLAHLGNLIGKLIPSGLVQHGAKPSAKFSKAIYSAKTTFLSSFLIIGRK
ncbi:MAG: class I SAM-dependent methyltransferase [Anaerolineales bacterium]|nr:class I SAM-dependent methyltransferase [Anaerolineales bacterium]